MTTDAINKKKQNLATKEIEQRFREKIEKQQNDRASIRKGRVHKLSDALKARNSEDGDPKAIRNHEDRGRIRSTITVTGHEVMRNHSEPICKLRLFMLNQSSNPMESH